MWAEVGFMKTYRELYLELFRALRDAAELLERGESFLALQRMIEAQKAGEEAHMEADILADR